MSIAHEMIIEGLQAENRSLRAQLASWRTDPRRCLREAYPNQRQDSLDDQLLTVCALANAAGCYDAADWIRSRTLYESPPSGEEQQSGVE